MIFYELKTHEILFQDHNAIVAINFVAEFTFNFVGSVLCTFVISIHKLILNNVLHTISYLCTYDDLCPPDSCIITSATTLEIVEMTLLLIKFCAFDTFMDCSSSHVLHHRYRTSIVCRHDIVAGYFIILGNHRCNPTQLFGAWRLA